MMKINPLFTTLKRLGASIAVLGLIVAVPSSQADEEKTKIKVKDGDNADDNDKLKVKVKDDKVKIKGKGDLSSEVTSAWIQGYTVPQEHRTHFTEVPVVEEDNVVVRYRAGRAYYIDQDEWKIVRVVTLDPSIEVAQEESVFVEGYVVPETYRTRFVEMPNPDAGVSIRYYGNTAYYMDDQYRIVRTVPLATR